MDATQKKNADFKVSLSAETTFTTPHAIKFHSYHIELHSLFGHLDFVVELNKASTQSHRSLGLSFVRDIATGTYPADGSGNQFAQFIYMVYHGRPDDSGFTQYTATRGTVNIEVSRTGNLEHFTLQYDVTAESADGHSIPIKGESEIYAKFHQ
ncbi:hypothetical protein [Pseudomonas paraveronii]|uniref:hypothetical protein n=1 Tax=Pseudomonas paraveronii TaxID=3040598 RepID=UPI002AB2E15E|nr:hypothetical protein [Pseudomonas sp. V3/K/3/5]